MKKEKKKKRLREYDRKFSKNAFDVKPNFKMVVSVVIIAFILLAKFVPESSINSVIGSIAKTNTNYVKMLKEIGAVITKHTTGINAFAAPCIGEITSGFGKRNDPITNELKDHGGIDYNLPLYSEVKAAYDGEVTRVEENEFYGKFIMIRHDDKTETLYGHLEEFSVGIGDKVKKGDIIAKSGNSGRSTGPHLHFEIRVDSVPVNPEEYLI